MKNWRSVYFHKPFREKATFNKFEALSFTIFRHKLYYAGLSMRPGCRAITTDACVPISKLPEMLIKTREDIDEAGLTGKI